MVLPSAQEGLGAEPSLLWQVQGFLTWEISALRGSEAASVGMMWRRAHPHGKTEGNAVLRLAAFGGQLVPLFPAAARSQLGASHGGNLRKRGRTFRNWKVPQAKLHPSAVIPSHCGKREQPQLPAALILPSCCILSLLNLLLVRCMDVTWKSLWWCLRGGEGCSAAPCQDPALWGTAGPALLQLPHVGIPVGLQGKDSTGEALNSRFWQVCSEKSCLVAVCNAPFCILCGRSVWCAPLLGRPRQERLCLAAAQVWLD